MKILLSVLLMVGLSSGCSTSSYREPQQVVGNIGNKGIETVDSIHDYASCWIREVRENVRVNSAGYHKNMVVYRLEGFVSGDLQEIQNLILIDQSDIKFFDEYPEKEIEKGPKIIDRLTKKASKLCKSFSAEIKRN